MPGTSFEIGGRVYLTDDMSPVVQNLVREVEQAGSAMEGLGTKVDAPVKMAKARLEELEAQMASIRQGQASGKELTVVDLENFQAAEGEVARLRSGMEAVGTTVTRTKLGMDQFYAATMGSAAGMALLEVATKAVDLARIGAQAIAVEDAFNGLTQSAGIAGTALVDQMTQAAHGTLDDTEIMIRANRMLLSGNQELLKYLPALFEGVRVAALATGRSVDDVFSQVEEGVLKANPRLIAEAGIFLRTADIMNDYAAAHGKSVNSLTMEERQAATAQATIKALGDIEDRAGGNAATAAEKIDSMSTAVDQLKESVGKFLVYKGVADWLGKLAEGINRGMDMSEGIQASSDALDKMRGSAAYDQAAVASLTKQLADLEAQRAKATMIQDWPGATADQMTAAAKAEQDVIDASKRLAAAIAAVQDAYSYSSDAGVHVAELERQHALAATKAADAFSKYRDALNQAAAAGTGMESLAGSMGNISAAIEAAKSGLAAMPQLPQNLLTVNDATIQSLLDYADAVDRAFADDSDMQRVTEDFRLHAAAIRDVQADVIAHANNISDLATRYDYLAKAILGPTAGVDELAAALPNLSAALQAAISPTQLLTLSLANLQAQASKPITPAVAMGGLTSALDDIDSMSLRLAGVLDPAQIQEFRERAHADVTQHWQTMGQTDKFGMDLMLAQETSGYDSMVANQISANKKMETEAQKHAEVMGMTASEMQGKIEAVLSAGTNVTPEQMQAAKAGTYADQALESYRRLQAVAERGFSELKVHPDWAAALKIPPEVLAGTEDQLKAWAGQTATDVKDLSRPDLIDWEAFGKQWDQAQQKEAAKGLTMSMAVDFLDKSGRLKGKSPEEAQAAVAEMLGLKNPAISFDARFGIGDATAAQGQLVTDFLAGKAAVDVPAKLVVTPLPTAAASGLGPPGVSGYTLPAPAPSGLGPPPVPGAQTGLGTTPPAAATAAPGITTPDMTKSGQDAAGNLYTSFKAAVEAQDMGPVVASAYQSDFQNAWKSFQTAGESAGGDVATGFLNAVRKGVGNVRHELAVMVAPEVADILDRQGRGKGPNE